MCRCKEIFEKLVIKLTSNEKILFKNEKWLQICANWKAKYPVTQPKHWEEDGMYANVYAFVNYLSSQLPKGNMTVVSNGSACVVGSHNYEIKKDARFLINSAIASMGYGCRPQLGHVLPLAKKIQFVWREMEAL